jgi:hypothetical protein
MLITNSWKPTSAASFELSGRKTAKLVRWSW